MMMVMMVMSIKKKRCATPAHEREPPQSMSNLEEAISLVEVGWKLNQEVPKFQTVGDSLNAEKTWNNNLPFSIHFPHPFEFEPTTPSQLSCIQPSIPFFPHPGAAAKIRIQMAKRSLSSLLGKHKVKQSPESSSTTAD